jgi:hypothetical protein
MERRNWGFALVGVLGLGACATPGIDYEARLPAGDPTAASFREVGVDEFRGPDGSWYTGAFEQMIAGAQFDGEPWFLLVTSFERPQGVYRGNVDVSYLDETIERNIVTRCVEYDAPFDCERRAEVVEICVNYTVEAVSRPQLIDLATGRPVWSGSFTGQATDRDCYELGPVEEYRDRGPRQGESRRHRWLGGGFDGPFYRSFVVDGLIREALGDTLDEIRAEIAPRNAVATARLITEALDPEVKGDPNFGFAVKMAKDGNIGEACAAFQALAEQYPAAPDVKFNLAACTEANGDYARAQALYAEVNQSGVKLPGFAREALSRINTRRAGEAEVDRQIERVPGYDNPTGS